MYEDVEIDDGPASKFQAALGARARPSGRRLLVFNPKPKPLAKECSSERGVRATAARKWQHYLDLSAPHTGPRWILTLFVVLIYCLRVYLINGAPRAATKGRPAFIGPRGAPLRS